MLIVPVMFVAGTLRTVVRYHNVPFVVKDPLTILVRLSITISAKVTSHISAHCAMYPEQSGWTLVVFMVQKLLVQSQPLKPNMLDYLSLTWLILNVVSTANKSFTLGLTFSNIGGRRRDVVEIGPGMSLLPLDTLRCRLHFKNGHFLLDIQSNAMFEIVEALVN